MMKSDKKYFCITPVLSFMYFQIVRVLDTENTISE